MKCIFMQKVHYALLCCFILLAHTTYNHLAAVPSTSVPSTMAPQSTNTHIIFDLGGVLVDTNKSSIFWQLGPKKLALYCLLTGKSPHALKRTLYMVMNSVERHSNIIDQAYDDEGLPLPSIMYNWLSGKQNNKQILTKLTHAIAEHPEWFVSHAEQIIIQNLVNILFTPQKFISTRTFIHKGINLVKWCKEKGFKVYILSNWDSESFALLRAQNPAIFDLFDGIIISGDHNCLKPNAELYHILLKTFNITPDNCVMIDDRIENIQTARTLHIHGIHCNTSSDKHPDSYDFKAIEKEIRAWAKYTEKVIA